MSTVSGLFLIGSLLFFAGALLLTVAYVYYIWRGLELIQKCRVTNHAKWTATRWLYPLFIISLLLMAILYLSMYLGQGFSAKPNNLLVMWERWLILSMIAFLFAHVLTHIMTIHSKDEQSFLFIFLYTLAYLFMLAATLSQAYQTRLLWISVAICTFLGALVFYVFPSNKFDAFYHIPASFPYYLAFFGFIFLYFLYNVGVYFLCASNECTQVLDFYHETLAYLIGDAVFVLGFSVVIAIGTFVNLHDTLRVVNKKTCLVTFETKK